MTHQVRSVTSNVLGLFFDIDWVKCLEVIHQLLPNTHLTSSSIEKQEGEHSLQMIEVWWDFSELSKHSLRTEIM